MLLTAAAADKSCSELDLPSPYKMKAFPDMGDTLAHIKTLKLSGSTFKALPGETLAFIETLGLKDLYIHDAFAINEDSIPTLQAVLSTDATLHFEEDSDFPRLDEVKRTYQGTK